MEDRTGDVLDGRYRLESLLGEGGMGQVYQGVHLVTGRKVAVKFLLPELADNAEAVGRFYREARAATAIGSEHICEVLDMCPPETGEPFLVMEYLKGETLKDRLARDIQLQLADTGHIFLQVLEALHEAHKAGIVHRDIKPENVFLLDRGERPTLVKLLDFGISKFSSHGTEDHSLTRTGTVLGTPYYMSPEQASGDRDVGPLSDLYAVGVMLYESLTGAVPFDAESFSALVVKIVTETPVHPCQRNGVVPQALGDMVLKSMARSQDDRFDSAKDMAQGLRGCLGGATGNYAAAPADESFSLPMIDGAYNGSMSGPSAGVMADGGSAVAMIPGASGVSQQTQTPMTMERLGESRSQPRMLFFVLGGAALAGLFLVVLAVVFLLPGLSETSDDGQGEVAAAVVNDVVPESPPSPVMDMAATVDASEAADQDAGAQAAQVEAAPAAPATVNIRFQIEPDNARVFLDDERLAEGASATVELPADGAVHRLRVEARGYTELLREFTANEDQVIALELERTRRRSSSSGGRTKQEATKRGGRRGQYKSVTGVVTPSGWD
jgi:serine/threonine-protein kinase